MTKFSEFCRAGGAGPVPRRVKALTAKIDWSMLLCKKAEYVHLYQFMFKSYKHKTIKIPIYQNISYEIWRSRHSRKVVQWYPVFIHAVNTVRLVCKACSSLDVALKANKETK